MLGNSCVGIKSNKLTILSKHLLFTFAIHLRPEDQILDTLVLSFVDWAEQ